jgi:hypothetical protein
MSAAKTHVSKEHPHITIIDSNTKKRSHTKAEDTAAAPKSSSSKPPAAKKHKPQQQQQQQTPAVAGHKPSAGDAVFSTREVQHFHELVLTGRRAGVDLEARYPFQPITSMHDFLRSVHMLASLELLPFAMRCAQGVVDPEAERRAAAEKREHSNRACFLASFVEEPEEPEEEVFEGL